MGAAKFWKEKGSTSHWIWNGQQKKFQKTSIFGK
jgi:hypothetical protein